jgi:beta-glucanase (GH16 family)
MLKRLALLVGALLLAAPMAHAQNMEIKDTASGKCWAANDYKGSNITLATCDGSASQRFTSVAMNSQSGKNFLWFNDGSWQFCAQASQPLHLDACWDDVSSQQGFTVNGSIAYGAQTVIFGTDGLATLYTPPAYVPPAYTEEQQTEAPPPTGDFAPSGYTLAANDEFNEANLDTTKWWTRGSYSGGTQDHDNDVVSRYRESGNHVMTGTTLQLSLLGQGADGVGVGLYPTGMIRSKFTLPLASGSGYYIAIRAKVPNGMGTWPAFWLAPDDRETTPSWPPELGPMEIITNATRTASVVGLDIQTNGEAWPGPIFNTTVVGGSPDVWSAQYNLYWPQFDASADFHVYALQYKAGNWTASIDGIAYAHGTYNWNYSVGVPANPASIICNLEFGGSTGGTGGLTSTFPQVYELDWLRVYTEPGAPALGVSTVGQDLMPASGG